MESEVRIENGKIVLSDEMAHEVSRWGSSLKAYLEGHSLIIVPEDGINLLEPVSDPLHPGIKYRRGASGWEPAIRGTNVTVRAVARNLPSGEKVTAFTLPIPSLAIAPSGKQNAV
jgi:uncharacterized protein (DUF433 family)